MLTAIVCARVCETQSCPQIERKGPFLVRFHVPTQSVEQAGFDTGDRQAFIGELFRLPCESVASPGKNRVMTGKEQQTLRGERTDLKNRPERDQGESQGRGSVDQVSVAAGGGADLFRIRTGP